jgi:hypothetical protein
LTETYLIDGQALDPSYFGQLDAQTGQWIPKSYTGAYGTNGFYLKFADNSNTTAATLGKDSSGNGNNWTPNGFATQDQMLDSPTNNFCTLNPLDQQPGASTDMVISGGNLTVNGGAGNNYVQRGNFWFKTGKWYCRVKLIQPQGGSTQSWPMAGIISENSARAHWIGYSDTNAWSICLGSVVSTTIWNGASTSWSTVYGANDYLDIAVDVDAGKLWFGKNGTWSGNPDGSTGAAFSNLPGTGTWLTVGCSTFSTYGVTWDFQSSPPTNASSFKTLCTANLPTPAIKKPSQYFDTATWTGTGAPQSIPLALQPDLAWFKCRSNTANHGLWDSIRGTSAELASNAAGTETSVSDAITAFTPTGVTLGADASGFSNYSGRTFAGWFWKKGTSPGFDIQTGTSDGSGTLTLTHSLGAPPAFIIYKERNYASSWDVWHQSLTLNQCLILSGMSATVTNPNFITTLNSTTVTNTAIWHASQPLIAYLWAEVAGFSKFGSYTGNGSADGPFVYCGFKPKFVIWKCSTTARHWMMSDGSRNSSNPVNFILNPNLSNSEITDAPLDFLSNGFKVRADSAYLTTNNSGDTYIFAAFAEAPFKYATAL